MAVIVGPNGPGLPAKVKGVSHSDAVLLDGAQSCDELVRDLQGSLKSYARALVQHLDLSPLTAWRIH